MNEGPSKEHYSVEEAAVYLNMSTRFIRRLVAERRITFYKVGRYVQFKHVDLEQFVQAGRVDPITAESVRRDLRKAS